VLANADALVGEEVVVTVKLDGENSSLYQDGLHARSLSPLEGHASRNRLKALHSQICGDIPRGWRVCLENCYAKHSIHYQNLRSWFFAISVWDRENHCLSWDDTVEWAALLDLETVPVLWRGVWDEGAVRGVYSPTFEGDECEGYVVRVVRSFAYGEFSQVLGKYVRAGHVDEACHHWMYQPVVVNELR